MSNKIEENRTFFKRIKKNEPWFHILFWLTFFLFPLMRSIGPGHFPFNFYSQLNDLFFGMLVFYISYSLFLPARRNRTDIMLLIASLTVLAYFNFKIHNWLFQGTHQEIFLNYIFSYAITYVILFLFAYALFSVKDNYYNQIALEKAAMEKKMAELSGLKAQINPHFLFNTLNAIYSSALKKDAGTPDMILKLSDNFRYLLHEGQKDQVPLKKEIRHIKDYVSLQEDRLTDKVSVDFDLDIDDGELMIAPLLFTPFLENAFKYTGLLKGDLHRIGISMTLRDEVLRFACFNPTSLGVKTDVDLNWKKSGIGISNTRQRLENLYPDRYSLSITESDQSFDVSLTIQL